MIEIIIGVWLASLLLSAIIVSVNYYLTLKRISSEPLTTLDFNLAKVGMFWSHTAADFSALTPQAIQRDAHRALRNSLLIGLLGLASVLGLIILFIVVISLHFLARSRKEMAVFRSSLVTDKTLSKYDVEQIMRELTQIT